MRKDLRIGLGIGAVLLLVLVVALVVRSNGRNNRLADSHTPPDEDSTVDNQGNGTDSTSSGTANTSQPPVASVDPTPAPGQPLLPKPDVFSPEPGTPDTHGKRAASGDTGDWERLLSGGNETAVTVTPPPAAGGRRGAASTGSGATAALPPMIATSGRRPDLPPSNLLEPTGTGRRTSGNAGAATGSRTHVVQEGETFTSIARSVYGNPRYYLQIQKANPNVNPNALKVGTSIVLPPIDGSAAAPASGGSRTSRGAAAPASGQAGVDRTREYRVESGDSLYKISEKLYGDGAAVDAIYALNRDAIGPDQRKLKLGMILKLPQTPTVASGR